MEIENQKLLKVQEQLSKYFIFLSGRCRKLQKKCNKYVDKLQNTDELNVNIQKSSVRLIRMMKIFKGNMSLLISSFENDLKELDPNKNSQLFEEIYKTLLDYKTTVVSLEEDNKYVFTKLCDKETFTEENVTQTNSSISTSTSDLDQKRFMNNSLVDCNNISPNICSSQNSVSNELTEDTIVISSESGIKAGCSSVKNRCTRPGKTYNLSLQFADETDGQDTDDSWTDSLKPNSPLEVKTRQSPQQESGESEEDVNDAETVDTNETESTPDDIFEDGHSTPKEEIIKEERDLNYSEELLSVKEESIIDFKEESNSPKKSKEVDMIFSEDFKEEPSISLKSEEIDMLFSEDSPRNATNPDTSETHENGKSSESATNLENDNPNNFLKIDEVKNKDASNTNLFKKNEECNKLNSVCDISHDEKLLAHADSNRCNSGSPCLFSENESDGSLETVKCSNNDSQSPYKSAKTVSRILKIPVEIGESFNESKQLSGSSYTVDRAKQITKKSKPKSTKKVSSSQKLQTPKKSRVLMKNQVVESDSGNITNSQSSATSESTETSNSSLNDTDEQAKSPNRGNKEYQDRRSYEERELTIVNLNKSVGRVESPNTTDMECQVSGNDDDEDSAVSNLKYFDDQTKSLNSENIECQDTSSNEDDENSGVSNLNDCDERAGSPNSVNIEYEYARNDEDKDEESAISSLNNSECQDKGNIDDGDSDIANIQDFDEGTNNSNSENIEDLESSNDEDEESDIDNRKNNSAIANLKDRAGKAESQNSKRTESLHSRSDKDKVSVNVNVSNSDDHLDSRDDDNEDYDEQAESPNLENIACLDSRNKVVSAIAYLNNSDKQTGSPNCENIQCLSIINDDGKESAIVNTKSPDKQLESLNLDKIEHQGIGNDDSTESSILEINDSYEQEEIPNSENIDSDATEIADNETVEIDVEKAEAENIYSMATQVISNIDEIELKKAGDRSSCISDTVNKYCSPQNGNENNDTPDQLSVGRSENTEELNRVKSSSGTGNKDVSDVIGDVYSLETQDLSVMKTNSGNLSTKNKYDFKEAETDDIYSLATQIISNIDKIRADNIGDKSSCISDTVNKYCSPHDGNTEHEDPKKSSVGCSENTQELNTVESKSTERTSVEKNTDVSDEIDDVYSLATQDLSVMETNSGNKSKSDNESTEPDLNEKDNSVTGEIANPFSVETVKLVSDEDVDESDSQSSRISEKCSEFLNEHNYSCASASDLDDSTRNLKVGSNPGIEDSDFSETGNGGVLEDVDKVDSELNLEDFDSNTMNMKPEAETDENGLASPTPPMGTNVTGDIDSKNSQSELTDIVDTSYIYSEHNYSSGGSPGPQNSSSDTEDEVVENSFADSVDQEESTDADSDVTDIDREVKKDLVNESEDVKLQPEKVLANLDEIPDSQEDVALSQQSTKSYEFDISENVNCLGDLSDVESEKKHTLNENIDIAQKDEIGAEDIAKELENLLSEDISDSKSEDDDTDITASDLDLSDAKSVNVETSSSSTKSSTLDQIEQRNTEDCLESSENNNEKEQTILINSNVESAESLLDITMEEFLSDFQKDEKVVDSQTTIILDDDDIKPKLEPTQIEENELDEPKTLDQKQNDIGDEILELLKEVSLPTLENADVPEQPLIEGDESNELKEAEDILKMMETDSSDDSSELDIDDDLLSDTSVEINDKNEPTTDSASRMAQALAEHNMVSCYVDLERLQLPEDDLVKYSRKLEDNIDWLCDLTTLNKRKGDGDLPFEKLKRTKKLRRENLSTGHSSSSSSDDSDLEVCGYRSGTPILPKQVEEKLDVFLANAIFRDLKGNNDMGSEQSGAETDESSKKKQKNNTASVDDGGSETNKIDETDTDTNNGRTKIGEEELLKKAWKHDPLLRGKLSSQSDTDNTNTDKSSKQKRKRRRCERENEFSVASDNLDSDSDLEGVREKNKSKLEENLISPIKRNIPSSDSSDSDSDIEFVPQKVRTPLKEGEPAVPSPSQKGRRNIRALMSQESLAEATKRANMEETERIERLKDRHKVIETFSQSFSQSQGQEEDVVPFVLDVDEITGEPLVEVNPKITAKLKPHQKIGIQFMWDSCYESVKQMKKYDGSGCILAHCMGLGKTLQALTLINTLFTYEETNTKHVLVVCPLSTVNNWLKEVKFAFEGFPEEKNFSVFSISNRNHNKYDTVKTWWVRKKAILILGYESFEILTNDRKLDKIDDLLKELILEALIDPGPDLVICDEGHLLRNKNALKSMALSKIRSKRRIILTGTPLQNNLLEYYHMVQFVKPDLLGNSKEFKTNFVNPITNGQYEDSTEDDIKLMMERTHVLHRLLVKTVQRIEDTELEIYLPKMMDHALFIQLSQVQVELYNHFSGIVKVKAQKQHKGFLSEFAIFQYICTHPQILAIMEKMRNKRIKERDVITNEEDQPICHLGGWWKEKLPEDAVNKIEYGNKLVVLRAIIEACEEVGDKLLVFSQCLGELDLIEHFLKTIGTSKCPSWQKKRDYSRMDGTVYTEDRAAICDNFNDRKNKTLRLLLMSTKVGGLGLNLTAANRVIIMTVNWNPSYDTQSVFRAYRFGQEKEVYVYRLISLDTMEEKVYHRTVTKLAIAHRVIDKHQIRRHYRRMHLQELYSCEPTADEGRPTPNVPEDQMLAKVILKLPCIFKFHEHKSLLENRPEDNLSEQQLTSAWEAWKNNEIAAQAPPAKAQVVPHPKIRTVPPPKIQGIPAQPTQIVPAQPTQTVPAQQTQAVPPQKTQTVPPQKTRTVPPQRNRTVPLLLRTQAVPQQRTQAVPQQRTQAVSLQKTQALPLQKTQAVPLQRTQAVPMPTILAVPPQNGQAVTPQWTNPPPSAPVQPATPPLATSMAAINFLVGRSNLNKLANPNLSRVPVSNVSLDHESRQYFFPKKNNVIPSLDLPNLPIMNVDVTSKIKENLQNSNARKSPPIRKGAINPAKLARKLSLSKTPATSISNKQVVHNGQQKRELNLLPSPTIPVSNGNIPKPSSNTLGAAAGGNQSRTRIPTGLTNIHRNIKKMQESPKTSPPTAKLPNVMKVKPQTPRMTITQRKLVPSQLPLDSQANIQKNPLNKNFTKSEGDSPNESNLRSKHKNKNNTNSTPIQNKKDTLQRLSLNLNGIELIKKKPTNENAIPSQDRQNSSVKRKIEVDYPRFSKKRKVDSNVPSNDNRGVQTIILDDLPKQQKKNRTGYTSDSRVASIRLDERDATSSDSGSLSSAIINNLKLSGVTIRKAPSNPKDVIMLD